MIHILIFNGLSWLKSKRNTQFGSTAQTPTSSTSLPPLGHRGGCGMNCTYASGQGSSPVPAWIQLVGTKTRHWFRSLKEKSQNGRVSINGYFGTLTLNCSGVTR